MKKRGFTLIELLLTMGIIGAVAALTVPGLASNFSKSHIGNTLARTVEQIELGNRKIIETANMEYTQNGDSPTDTLGGISLKDIPHSETDASDTDSFAEAIQDVAPSYWAVSELNLTDTEESAISSAKVYDGSADSEYTEELASSKKYKFAKIPANVYIASLCDSASNEDLSDADFVIAHVFIDVDGHDKGKNAFGRDLFIFDLHNDGTLEPYGKDSYETDCVKGNVINGGYACSARVMADGWKVNY